MTGLIGLDWAMLTVSLFNALLLLWLGLTVLLNAERRVWGIWLSSTGLLLGSIFFASHSAIMVQGIYVITPGLKFWWQIGWMSVVSLPFMWYLAVLWYTGYWDHPKEDTSSRSRLNHRQRKWLALVVLYGLILISLVVFTDLLPSLNDLVSGRFVVLPAIIGIAALILFYVLCIGLSMDALWHAEKSRRLMGELACAGARRWLMATSILLLCVSLLLGGVMVWIVMEGVFQSQQITAIGWLDLGIALMIALSILLLGQAVVSYEVFTGKTLPRRALARYWQWAVIMAAGFSLLVSGSLVAELHPIFTLLLSAVVMMIFFAILVWHSYAERERLITNLRPFASSQKMIDSLLNERSSVDRNQAEQELEALFHVLCQNVLESERAGLFPYGQLALLTGQPSFYPPGNEFYARDLEGIAAKLQDGNPDGCSLESGQTEGAIYAVPLWRESGLSGMMLLGQKLGGRPYTQEEIEIAQATGERLIDARASIELTRRLLHLQRKHMVTGQVIDQRVRRKVHDEILPQVHTAILELAVPGSENGKALEYLNEIHKQLSNLLQSLSPTTVPTIKQIGLVGSLQQTVELEMEGAFDKVEWQIETHAEKLANKLPPLISGVIYAAVREGIRNAARHGRGEGDDVQLCLQIVIEIQDECELRIKLEDNGVGFHIQLPPGEYNRKCNIKERDWSEPENRQCEPRNFVNLSQINKNLTFSSNGQGLELYSTLLAVIGGSLTVDSFPGQYTSMTLELPCSIWVN
jgi:signal transduction histidine kinase